MRGTAAFTSGAARVDVRGFHAGSGDDGTAIYKVTIPLPGKEGMAVLATAEKQAARGFPPQGREGCREGVRYDALFRERSF